MHVGLVLRVTAPQQVEHRTLRIAGVHGPGEDRDEEEALIIHDQIQRGDAVVAALQHHQNFPPAGCHARFELLKVAEGGAAHEDVCGEAGAFAGASEFHFWLLQDELHF